jgi:hypothetical protein
MRTPHPTFATVPEQRTYIHLPCGRSTVVDGDDFRGLCDPVGGLFGTTTFCTICNQQDRLDRFIWADTKESIADYRRRMRSTVSPFYMLRRRMLQWLCVPIGPLVLAYLAWRFVPKFPVIAAIVAFIVALFVGMIAYGLYLGSAETDFRKYR